VKPLRIKSLKRVVNCLLEQILEQQQEVTFDNDYYQWLQKEAFFTVPELWKEGITIGQLSCDIEAIEAISRREHEPDISDLARIAALLIGLQYQLLKPCPES
jgi:hypothetical protein